MITTMIDFAHYLYKTEYLLCFLAGICFTMIMLMDWCKHKWKREHRPSTIKIFIPLLFFSWGYSVYIGDYSRMLRMNDQEAGLVFFNSWMWHTRVIPRLICEAVLAYRGFLRVLKWMLFGLNGKRVSDKDGSDLN